MIVCRKPYLTKASLDVDFLDQLFPLMFKTGDVEPDVPTVGIGRSDAVNSGVPFRDKAVDLFERAGVPRYPELADVDWRGALFTSRRPFMAHEGACACGKRTYLYGRCFGCKRSDKREEELAYDACLNGRPERAGGAR